MAKCCFCARLSTHPRRVPHLVESICDSYLNRLKTDIGERECGFSNEDVPLSCSLIVEQSSRLFIAYLGRYCLICKVDTTPLPSERCHASKGEERRIIILITDGMTQSEEEP